VSDLTTNISNLSEGTHHRTYDVEAENVGLDSRFKDRVRVQAVLDKTGHQVHLKTKIQTSGRFTCDRCAEEFEHPLSAQYEIVYIVEESQRKAGIGDEVQYLTPDMNVLDLGEDVRQFLILAVPQKLLCKDECQGLCPKCGVNRNKVQCNCTTQEIDPRWEGLKKMSLN
jgi:uncharacterized protein